MIDLFYSEDKMFNPGLALFNLSEIKLHINLVILSGSSNVKIYKNAK